MKAQRPIYAGNNVTLAAETDQLLKERYITIEQTMTFYQSKLTAARAREHREALATHCAGRPKADAGIKRYYFVAEPLTTPRLLDQHPKGIACARALCGARWFFALPRPHKKGHPLDPPLSFALGLV